MLRRIIGSTQAADLYSACLKHCGLYEPYSWMISKHLILFHEPLVKLADGPIGPLGMKAGIQWAWEASAGCRVWLGAQRSQPESAKWLSLLTRAILTQYDCHCMVRIADACRTQPATQAWLIGCRAIRHCWFRCIVLAKLHSLRLP